MSKVDIARLASREREVAQIVYANGEASADDIARALSDPISNAAIRSMLRRLQTKNVLRRRKQGKKYLYAPAASDEAARKAALRRVCREYFGGSIAEMADWAAALAAARSEPKPARIPAWRQRRVSRVAGAIVPPMLTGTDG